MCASLLDFVLERDPENIFYYQCDVGNYTDLVLDFLLFDKHEYTRNLLVSNSAQYIYVTGLCNFLVVP